MCGRFVSATTPVDLARYFDAALTETLAAELRDQATPPGNFNTAPTDDLYAVVDTPRGSELAVFRWGLIPGWAKDRKIGATMINARAETLREKPAFKSLFASRRCLIAADGFYEWKVVGNDGQKPIKQPLYIHAVDQQPLAFAGLWTTWRDPASTDGTRIHTATIITTAANETMAPVHDRMPAILPRAHWHDWLHAENADVDHLHSLLVPAAHSVLTMSAVSAEVNNVRNNGPHLVEPVET